MSEFTVDAGPLSLYYDGDSLAINYDLADAGSGLIMVYADAVAPTLRGFAEAAERFSHAQTLHLPADEQ